METLEQTENPLRLQIETSKKEVEIDIYPMFLQSKVEQC